MAKTTSWTAAVNFDYTNAGNWSNGYAVDGDTIDIASEVAPQTNRPTEGLFNFSITTAGLEGPDVSYFGDGLTAIGDLTVDAAGAFMHSDIGSIGNVVVTAGKLDTSMDLGDADTDTVTIGAAGEIDFAFSTLVVHGPVANAGLMFQSAPATYSKAVTLSGNGTIGDGTWTFNGGLVGSGIVGQGGAVTITGIVNLTTAVWDIASGSLQVNANSTLDLGADVPELDVEIAADVTLPTTRDLVCHEFKHTSGEFTFNGRKVVCDSFVPGAGTFADTGIIDIGGVGALKTEVAAAAKVLAGEPRWTGATGADVGVLNTLVRIGD